MVTRPSSVTLQANTDVSLIYKRMCEVMGAPQHRAPRRARVWPFVRRQGQRVAA